MDADVAAATRAVIRVARSEPERPARVLMDPLRVLQQLASLTGNRDLAMLEGSLLLALEGMLSPAEVALLTVDRAYELRSVRRWSRSAGLVQEPVDREAAPSPWLRAAEALSEARRRSEPTYRALDDGLVLAVYPLMEAGLLKTCVGVMLPQSVVAEVGGGLYTLLRVFRNFCNVIDDSQRDELTGLLNRKTFDDNLHRVIRQASGLAKVRFGSERRRAAFAGGGDSAALPSHWIAIIDIDHFKRINDGFGHLFGDEVLVTVAQILCEAFRDTDLIYRFGGEEFVVIATNTGKSGAREAFERFRTQMAARSFPQLGTVTVSYGATEVTASSQPHRLLDDADQALYYAKEHGRNQGHLHQDLVAAGELSGIAKHSSDVELF